MFQVGRYDPQAEERKSRKVKGRKKRINDERKDKRTKKRKQSTSARGIQKDDDDEEDVENRHSDKHGNKRPQPENVKENSTLEIQEKKSEKDILNKKASAEVPKVAENLMSVDEPTVMKQNASSTNQDDKGMESDSSSSVPSSTDDDSSDSDDDERVDTKKKSEPAMHVIAPEQAPVGYLNRKNLGTKVDEEMDDFDDDDALIEKEHLDGNGDDDDNKASADATNTNVSEEISTALHMSSLPIKDAAATWGLASFLVNNLEKDGYDTFFPIQSLVIPDVIASERHAHIRARDICVAAPTGSGKTLAFVLPVLNALAGRKIRRLRALVVLPSRDLAMQVYKVFDRYTEGSNLKVGLAIGQSDFKAEQEALTVETASGDSLLSSKLNNMEIARQRYHFHRGDLPLALQAFPGIQNEEAPSNKNDDPTLKGGRSAVDVLVATPGRLVDHLSKTPGFTLQHLRFLVIDEADRLVNQSYHNWIGRVVGAANEASIAAWTDLQRQQEEDSNTAEGKHSVIAPPVEVSSRGNSFKIDPITWRRGGASGDSSEFNTNNAFSSVVATVCRPVQLRKLLYSATLTRDPQKLASLGLINAKHFDAHQLNSANHASEQGRQQRYSMPSGLSEYTVECTAEQKPLVLLALLLDQISKQTSSEEEDGNGIIVVFTSSLDSTHRLARLLQLLWSALGHGPSQAVAEFSSALTQKQRSSLMKQCNSPDSIVSVIVCSDGMSRGMDIPSVSAVINYDVPSFAKTYVHRCGRTARAGRKGSAISVLKGGQVTQFNRMRRLIDHPNRVVADMGIRKDLVRHAVPAYRASVKVLRKVIQAESDNDLNTVEPIPANWISASSA